MATMIYSCAVCSADLPETASFCPSCGAKTPTSIDKATGKAETLERAEINAAKHQLRLQQAIGDTIEIRGVLGRGGFADIFVAWDTKLRRELAVKTLRGDVIASPSMLERFQRETHAIAG